VQNFSNISLPEQLRALFLDVTFEDLSWDLHHDFIAARILERGSLQDIKWLRGHWGDIALRDYILNRRGKGLNPRQNALLAVDFRPARRSGGSVDCAIPQQCPGKENQKMNFFLDGLSPRQIRVIRQLAPLVTSRTSSWSMEQP
jgi:hypothetical protein